MGRPTGPPRRHLNIAPPVEVADALKAFAKRIGVSQTSIIELAVRKLLAEKGVVVGAKKGTA